MRMFDFDLVVVGDYCLDLVFTGLPDLPKLGREIAGQGFDQVPGGAYNTAAAAHRLGLRVGWACDFGNDPYSRIVLEWARTEGLPEDAFVHHDRPLRNITVALSYEHERAFVAYYDPPPAIPAAMIALSQAQTRALLIPGQYSGSLLDDGLPLARSRRMKVVMDGNSNWEVSLAEPAVRRAIASVDVFLPNADEAKRLTGEDSVEQAARFLARVCPLVVVKDGSAGAVTVIEDKVVRVAAIPVQPVDTTGAGDCFNAGFVRAWLDSRPVAECMQWGNIVGGLSTLARGGVTAVTGEKEVRAWLERMPKNR